MPLGACLTRCWPCSRARRPLYTSAQQLPHGCAQDIVAKFDRHTTCCSTTTTVRDLQWQIEKGKQAGQVHWVDKNERKLRSIPAYQRGHRRELALLRTRVIP